MTQLTFAAVPGFYDLSDAVLAGDQPLTDDDMVKLNQNAKFAAVRTENIFMGWYKHADVIPTPISLVDGYAYARAECQFVIGGWGSTATPVGFISGQAARPSIDGGLPGGPSAAGEMLRILFDIDDATGTVYCQMNYYVPGGAETPTHDGMIKVYCVATRSSVNVSD